MTENTNPDINTILKNINSAKQIAIVLPAQANFLEIFSAV
jgi:hypothetical protein